MMGSVVGLLNEAGRRSNLVLTPSDTPSAKTHTSTPTLTLAGILRRYRGLRTSFDTQHRRFETLTQPRLDSTLDTPAPS